MVRSTGVVLLATLAALALVACSTSSKVSGAQQTAIDQADPICQEAQQKIGLKLGDDPDQEVVALKQATDKLQAIDAPSENATTWLLFNQGVNNLWLNIFDVSEALKPNVNDRNRATKAIQQAGENNELIKKNAGDYGTDICKDGFAPQGTKLP